MSEKKYEENYSKLIKLVESLSIANAQGKVLYSSRSTLVPGQFYFIGYNPGGDPKVETIQIVDHLRQTPEMSWTEFTHGEWFSRGRCRPAGQTDRQRRVVKLFNSLKIRIEQTLLTNSIFARAPDVDQTKIHPAYDQYRSDSAQIHGLLVNIVKPKVVVAFGADAASEFLRHERQPGFKKQTNLSSAAEDYVIVKIPHFAFRRGGDVFMAQAEKALRSYLEEYQDPYGSNLLEAFPIAVIQDRYGGVYSGGEWLAIAAATSLENGAYRIIRSLEDGPYGDDPDAALFWQNPPSWIASGKTPEEALHNLKRRVGIQ